MKSVGIVRKLFIITSTAFFLFLIIIIAFQSTFFEKLYFDKKLELTKKTMKDFSSDYSNIMQSSNSESVSNSDMSKKTAKIIELLNNYTSLRNSTLSIVDETFYPKYSEQFYVPYSLQVLSTDGKKYSVNIEGIFKYGQYELMDFKPGDKISIKGYLYSNSNTEIDPYLIEYNGKDYYSEWYAPESNKNNEIIDDKNNFIFDNNQIPESISSNPKDSKLQMDSIEFPAQLSDDFKSLEINIDGKVITVFGMDAPQAYYDSRILAFQNDLLKVFDQSGKENYMAYYDSGNEFTRIEFDSKENNNSSILLVKKLVSSKGETEYLVSLTSLQPIGEAMSVLKDYFIYFFLLAILFIALLSYVYSKLIAEPLIEMNSVAKKMACLNFQVRSNIKTKDELGSLSNSLNTLSTNLHSSLIELKEANDKLLDDIEKEKQQEEIRKDFIASVSHELKTPLGIIKGFAEGIKDGIYEEKKDYYLDVIVDEIDKMNYMVQEMLELSKLESKALMINKTDFNLKLLVNNLVNKFQGELTKKDLSVTLETEDCFICGDEIKIEQLLTNLYSNAIKYSPPSGQIIIKLSKSSLEAFNGAFSIENTSKQFSEDDILKVWDRFYRVDKSRSRNLGGTGLGLAICKDILEIHKFDFGVKNTSIGVKFFFNF